MEDMFADVILDQFRHEAVHRPADGCDEVQDFGAGRRTDGRFDGLHLPLQATDAGNELGFVLGKMAHNIGGYPIEKPYATHGIMWEARPPSRRETATTSLGAYAGAYDACRAHADANGASAHAGENACAARLADPSGRACADGVRHAREDGHAPSLRARAHAGDARSNAARRRPPSGRRQP